MHVLFMLLLSVTLVFSTWDGATAQSFQPPAPPQPQGVTPPNPPPPPPPANQLKVFYSVNGQVFGPFNKEQLMQKISAGEINRQTLVWMEGMGEWQAAATVAAVAPLLTTVPPEQQFDAAGFFAGTWEASGTGHFPDGTQFQSTFTVTYRPDGSLTGFGEMTAPTQFGQFRSNLSIKGTWKAETKTNNSFILTTNNTMTMTTAGQPPNTQTGTDSTLFTIIDRNTIATNDGSRSYRVAN